MHKLKLLPEVVSLMSRGGIKQSLVEPENRLIEGVRFFLEPLDDGSLPAYNIQRDMLAALTRLPIGKETLTQSGIGKVVLFYTRSKKPEPLIKRTAERLLTEWMRPILGSSNDYRQRDPTNGDVYVSFSPLQYNAHANPNRNGLPLRPSQMTASELARERALATPVMTNRARVEGGAGTYTIAPKSNIPMGEGLRAPGHRSDAAFRKIQMRQAGKGGGSKR